MVPNKKLSLPDFEVIFQSKPLSVAGDASADFIDAADPLVEKTKAKPMISNTTYFLSKHVLIFLFIFSCLFSVMIPYCR